MITDVPPQSTGDLALDPVQSAFDTAVQLLEAGRASLLIRETVDPVLTVAASVGIDPRLASIIKVQVGEGIAGLVAERGDPLLGMKERQSFISVPIRTERGIEGVLNATDRRGNIAYTTRDMALAVKAAAHIGRLIQFSRHAARDELSGLYNRRSFESMLEREVARSRRLGTGFAVIFLDLDNLKHINDRYGHTTGDEVIQRIGSQIEGLLRPYDVAARYGGDEFVILLGSIPTIEAESATQVVADRIAETAQELSQIMRFPVSISMGSGNFPADGSTGKEIVAVADQRMYGHKRRTKAHRQSS